MAEYDHALNGGGGEAAIVNSQSPHANQAMTDRESAVTPMSVPEIARHAGEAMHTIRAELAEIPSADLSPADQVFSELVNTPAVYGLVRTLDRHSIEQIDVAEFDVSDPRQTLREVLTSGQEALHSRGIPSPDLDIYMQAAEQAQADARPLEDVIKEYESAQPLYMRGELGAPTPGFSIAPQEQTLTPQGGARTLGMLSEPLLSETQTLGENFEPTNYQSYDVHLMAYPLAQTDLPFGLGATMSRDSHAYVVITEPGGNPLKDPLLVTRAGPDDNGMFLGSSGSDSSLGDEQNPTDTDKRADGDVYVSSFDLSEQDLRVPNAFTLGRTRITGDLSEIRDEISDFRNFINEQDINYELLHNNSNTYAGDIYEKLTGEEPENPHSGLFGRRVPALDNDLLNYEDTEYANDFS